MSSRSGIVPFNPIEHTKTDLDLKLEWPLTGFDNKEDPLAFLDPLKFSWEWLNRLDIPSTPLQLRFGTNGFLKFRSGALETDLTAALFIGIPNDPRTKIKLFEGGALLANTPADADKGTPASSEADGIVGVGITRFHWDQFGKKYGGVDDKMTHFEGSVGFRGRNNFEINLGYRPWIRNFYLEIGVKGTATRTDKTPEGKLQPHFFEGWEPRKEERDADGIVVTEGVRVDVAGTANLSKGKKIDKAALRGEFYVERKGDSAEDIGEANQDTTELGGNFRLYVPGPGGSEMRTVILKKKAAFIVGVGFVYKNNSFDLEGWYDSEKCAGTGWNLEDSTCHYTDARRSASVRQLRDRLVRSSEITDMMIENGVLDLPESFKFYLELGGLFFEFPQLQFGLLAAQASPFSKLIFTIPLPGQQLTTAQKAPEFQFGLNFEFAVETSHTKQQALADDELFLKTLERDFDRTKKGLELISKNAEFDRKQTELREIDDLIDQAKDNKETSALVTLYQEQRDFVAGQVETLKQEIRDLEGARQKWLEKRR